MSHPDPTLSVSNPAEPLILVDSQDRELGQLSKAECHAGEGVLHRAFSIHLIDGQGQLLLQQRSADKPLWPLYWSNSCCSHPRAGESMASATHRRLQQELGLDCELQYLYKFEYQARYQDLGAERELCWVYVGHCEDPPRANRSELADWRYCSPAEIDRMLAREPELLTPWFKLEWEALKRDYSDWLDMAHGPLSAHPDTAISPVKEEPG